MIIAPPPPPVGNPGLATARPNKLKTVAIGHIIKVFMKYYWKIQPKLIRNPNNKYFFHILYWIRLELGELGEFN